MTHVFLYAGGLRGRNTRPLCWDLCGIEEVRVLDKMSRENPLTHCREL